jgi:hypothetical protein
MVVAHGLTALLAGVTKCADNISGQSSKRSQRRRKGGTPGNTQEVEERSRWRWSPRRFGVHRNQDRFIPLRGPAVWSGLFHVHRSALTEPFDCRGHCMYASARPRAVAALSVADNPYLSDDAGRHLRRGAATLGPRRVERPGPPRSPTFRGARQAGVIAKVAWSA